jgi:hypothetical protein
MVPENENTIIPEGTGTVTPTVPEPEVVPVEGIVVNCTRLNVRKAPSVKAPVLCTIPVDSNVLVCLEESTDEFYWVETAAGVEGFCMKDYIDVDL